MTTSGSVVNGWLASTTSGWTMDDPSEFTAPIERGTRPVPVTVFRREDRDRLRERLAEFDRVRNRGAVEAHGRPLCG